MKEQITNRKQKSHHCGLDPQSLAKTTSPNPSKGGEQFLPFGEVRRGVLGGEQPTIRSVQIRKAFNTILFPPFGGGRGGFRSARNDVNGSTYKRKNKYVLFVFFLFTIAFAYPQTELEMLERAYKNNSKEELKVFFDNWSREITPITNEELSTYNDTIQEAYKVFVDFYNFNFSNLNILHPNDAKQYKNLYKNVNFLIVQNELKIYFVNKIHFEFPTQEGYLTDSITDFRPAIRRSGKTPLYLTKKYDETLNAFLGDGLVKLGKDGRDETSDKKEFLENYVKIDVGHWYDWLLPAVPEVYTITFDKNMKYAIIFYRISSCTGGEIAIKKEGNTWVFFRLISKWIQ